ncbi:MAG: cysteine synthase A [Arcobacteraceae bacterium]|jgi:cysteine synthase A|nr:cysteine synthase A [Arcobacteraceae bacterium]
MRIGQNVASLIGNTPIVRLHNIDKELYGEIYGKCEFMNPSSSIKDRIALHMITSALLEGKINKDTHIIEPTSGNTGIGLASICASMGLKLTLTMPESMSVERRQLIRAYGANIDLTPAHLGMSGAVNRAKELSELDKNSIVLDQFSNPNNPLTHEKTTALEILNDMDKMIDIFVAGVGTGGTISGVGKVLKEEIENVRIIAVEPSSSNVLSGGTPAPHKIQGIGAGFIPKTLNTTIYNEIIMIENDEAINMAREIAKNEGILVGISSGANVAAAIKLASKPENNGKKIVTILCDSGERYLSTGMFDIKDETK